jgi:octaprenyl-diphosphate synthase
MFVFYMVFSYTLSMGKNTNIHLDLDERRSKIEDYLKKAIPEDLGMEWGKSVFGSLPECLKNDFFTDLTTPCANLISLGGKRWRPLLLVLCAEMANNDLSKPKDPRDMKNLDLSLALENAYKLTPLVEFVHTASLIHDDIEDGADTRRGKPCAHITYGLDVAINSASWLYFMAGQCINEIDALETTREDLYELYAQELRRLHLGQSMDIQWHRNKLVFPTFEEYDAMVRFKTGTLSSLSVQAGILAGGGSADTAKKASGIAASIGAGFQILDDVQNLTTGNPGKKRGDDIVEGKKSLPVLMHIAKYPEDKDKISKLFEIAGKEGIESKSVEECIKLLEKGGCIKEAFNKGKDLVSSKSLELTKMFSKCTASTLIIELFNSMLPKKEI